MSRLFSRLRTSEGLLVFFLLLMMIAQPPLAIADANWVDAGDVLVLVAFPALLCGLILAKLPLPRLIAVPLGLVTGALLSFLTIGQVLPDFARIVQRLTAYIQWLQAPPQVQAATISPLSLLMGEIWYRGAAMAERVYIWLTVGVEGGTSSDNLIFLLILGILIWVATFYSAWVIYRYHNAVIALIPGAVVLSVNIFLANQGMFFMVVYLACALLLMVTNNLFNLRQSWDRRAIDYSGELNLDVIITSSWLSLLLVIVAFFLPNLEKTPLASAWWSVVSRPWGEVETTVNRLFSGVNNPNPDLGTGSKGALILGGSFERPASSNVFMYVETDEPFTQYTVQEFRTLLEEEGFIFPIHYWRGVTYDFYTGRGWNNSEKLGIDRTPDQPIGVELSTATDLMQTIEIVSPRADILFAANQPISTSVPYRLQALGPDDFSALYWRRAPFTTMRYQVRSRVPQAGTDDLRQAGTDYPPTVTKYYLQLPASLPQRVKEMARNLTKDALTPYDKAVAIQSYLRTLPYDRNVKLPTGDFDAVDYFLFIQKGYCDYFGTVMAVMLRAVGVPARLATGYLTGTYDWANHRYEVLEKDAHAWVEVYFPGFGWMDMEPTPAYSPIVYPEGSLYQTPNRNFPFPTPAVSNPAQTFFVNLGLPNLGEWLSSRLASLPFVLALLATAYLVWTLWPLWEQRQPPSQYVARLYNRMRRYAGWAGIVRLDSQTAHEYARILGEAVETMPREFRLGPWRWRSFSRRVGQTGVERLTDAFVAAQYGPRPLAEKERGLARQAWADVKDRLWVLAGRRLRARLGRRRVG